MTDSAHLIVAAFEPFHSRKQNRSWEVVRRLAARPGLETLQLPVDFARLKDLVPSLADQRPRGILFVGEASRKQVSVEQVALNFIDCDRPDNAGSKPQSEPIIAGGPLALQASWDARAVARRLNQNGIGAAASFHAGTFACNTSLYLALHAFPAQTSIGFLHIPHQRWPFGMRLGLLVQAVEVSLEVLREQPAVAASIIHSDKTSATAGDPGKSSSPQPVLSGPFKG